MNHRTAPIEVRERLALPLRDLTGALRALRLLPGVEEVVILSTCNRTECYAASARGEGAAGTLRGFLLERAGEAELAAGHLYALRGGEAITHLYRVSASVDSLVVGEPQVLGQVKAAYETARSEGVTGALLNRAFQGALEAGRRVRAETAIGTGLVSVSSVAVELARKIFGDLTSRKAIILGTGEMGELTLTHLVSQGVRVVLVANRTYERAVALARLHEGTAIRYEEFPEALAEVDIVISSTSAPHHVLSRDLMAPIVRRRHGRPLFLIDIAFPRDIQPAVGDLPGVFLYDLDDLEGVAEANRQRRLEALAAADRIVREEVEAFLAWSAAQEVIPVIRSLRDRLERIRRGEVDRVAARLGPEAPEGREVLEALSAGLLNKILHLPTVRLKEASRDGRARATIEALKFLFDLEGEGAERERGGEGG